MANVLNDTSAEALVPAQEANMIAFWSSYGSGEKGGLYTASDADWFYSGIPYPLFNGVLRLDTDAEGVTAIYAALQNRVIAAGAPALWWTGERSRPQDIADRLQQLGLTPAGEVPALVVELARLATDGMAPDGFSLHQVQSTSEQALWARVAAEGTGMPEVATQALAALEGGMSDPAYLRQRRYLGFLAGEPVASSALVLEAGVAGIYAVATLPQARRRGIGHAMTLLPLLDAREMGYRIGVLQSSSAGYSLYRKIGFRDVYKYALYLQS